LLLDEQLEDVSANRLGRLALLRLYGGISVGLRSCSLRAFSRAEECVIDLYDVDAGHGYLGGGGDNVLLVNPPEGTPFRAWGPVHTHRDRGERKR
jgi:hypothetical protein